MLVGHLPSTWADLCQLRAHGDLLGRRDRRYRLAGSCVNQLGRVERAIQHKGLIAAYVRQLGMQLHPPTTDDSVHLVRIENSVNRFQLCSRHGLVECWKRGVALIHGLFEGLPPGSLGGQYGALFGVDR